MTHKRWERDIRDHAGSGRVMILVEEMHKYPRSRGRVLRHIGADLEKAVELLALHHLGDINVTPKGC